MLRFFSNYLFQNENQSNETDPTTTPTNASSNSEEGAELQPGPKGGDDDKVNPRKGRTKEDFMDFEEGRGDEDSDEEEDEDDWVLIGDGEDKTKKSGRGEEGKLSEDLRVQEQPAQLVAAPSEPEKIQGGQDDDQEESDDDEEEDDDEDEEEDEEEPGLLWENKLIEHPSMSVYVDLATSVNTNCTSMSSIAPATSPGESVIVLEHQDDEDEPMDIIEVAPSPQEFVHVTTPQPEDIQEEMNPSDMENNVNSANISKSKPATAPAGGSAPAQNGRRKKGHYPCTSSNSSQMPRRAHLRSGGNPRVNQTFQMISSNSWASSPSSPSGNNGSTPGQILDSIHDTAGKRKRANNSANSTAGANATASACGIAIVGAVGAPGGPTAANNMINKNQKLVEMFPANAASVKKRQRHAGPRKANNTTEKGHFLQESKRRQDLQNHTKHSFVNNDRRSAQQRRVQKGAAAGAAGSGARNTK